MTERNFGRYGTLEYHDITLTETDDENMLVYIYTEQICEKVPTVGSKTVLVVRMLRPHPLASRFANHTCI